MPTITWNTDVDAPCCPGEIVASDGRSILIQQDTDFPGVATTFGWSPQEVQSVGAGEYCAHDGTDGTVDCRACGVKAMRFISAAREFLADADGLQAEDPGYFT